MCFNPKGDKVTSGTAHEYSVLFLSKNLTSIFDIVPVFLPVRLALNERS